MKYLFLLLPFIGFSQKIFTTDYPSQSDIKVFVVDYESQSDLKVFKVDYQSQSKGLVKNTQTWNTIWNTTPILGKKRTLTS